MFQMIIEKDQDAYFIAEYFNFSDKSEDYRKEEGVFRAKIKSVDYNKMKELLNYIDVENLEDNYSVSHTNAPSATLRITYNGSKVKKIHDYGKSRTFGLTAVYNLFNEFRFNQEWKSSKEPGGIRVDNF